MRLVQKHCQRRDAGSDSLKKPSSRFGFHILPPGSTDEMLSPFPCCRDCICTCIVRRVGGAREFPPCAQRRGRQPYAVARRANNSAPRGRPRRAAPTTCAFFSHVFHHTRPTSEKYPSAPHFRLVISFLYAALLGYVVKPPPSDQERQAESSPRPKPKRHGRNGADAYRRGERVKVGAKFTGSRDAVFFA